MLFDYLSADNILTLVHFTQESNKLLMAEPNGLFKSVEKLGFNDRLVRQQISKQCALELLEVNFERELTPIYEEISKFREGFKSIDLHTGQNSFEQMLFYLQEKSHMHSDSRKFKQRNGTAQPYPLGQTEKVRRIIFDSRYQDYCAQKAETSLFTSTSDFPRTSLMASSRQKDKLHRVEYECIKTDLRQ